MTNLFEQGSKPRKEPLAPASDAWQQKVPPKHRILQRRSHLKEPSLIAPVPTHSDRGPCARRQPHAGPSHLPEGQIFLGIAAQSRALLAGARSPSSASPSHRAARPPASPQRAKAHGHRAYSGTVRATAPNLVAVATPRGTLH